MRIFLALVLCVAAVSAQVEPAPECTDAEREKCTLPNCRCSGVDIPGGLQPEETPQVTKKNLLKRILMKYTKSICINFFAYVVGLPDLR